MLEVQVQFAVTFERNEIASWDLKLASALSRTLKWVEVQKLTILVDLNGVPLGTIVIGTHLNYLKFKRWFGAGAESSASNRPFFANNLLTS
jgi:hypothetical protein